MLCFTFYATYFTTVFLKLTFFFFRQALTPFSCTVIWCENYKAVDLMWAVLLLTDAWIIKTSNLTNYNWWDLRFWHQCCWGLRSSAMWHCVIGWVALDISKECQEPSSWTFDPWRWMYYIPSKHQKHSHSSSAMSRKIWILIL